MSFVIERVGVEIRPYVSSLLQYLPLLWQESEEHNMLRCAILTTLSNLVQVTSCDLPFVRWPFEFWSGGLLGWVDSSSGTCPCPVLESGLSVPPPLPSKCTVSLKQVARQWCSGHKRLACCTEGIWTALVWVKNVRILFCFIAGCWNDVCGNVRYSSACDKI